MKKILLIFILLLPFSITTNHPYYPLTTGESITYNVYDITGYWSNPTKELWVHTRSYVGQEYVTYGVATCPTFFGSAQLFTESYNGTYPLKEGGATVGGKSYLGEAVNHLGQVMIPFEAKITISPQAGEVIPPTLTTTYTGQNVCNNPPAASPTVQSYWTYRTIGWYQNWGVFPDVWRTGLHECGVIANCTPTAGQTVYNYAFMRGVGMVDFWYGVLDANRNVIGQEYYAIDW